ncbi:universal stress protein [Ktedonospora formicarum]|uniref:Universal stress protein UspA n=1 Tax=Ktedonospora formicarum TaxID=2778364 RepID=A0A8J3IC80_9CHLR|nr:universal stress protein [Ktedonospora formicarum]GHO48714.1 universal stress protein UspA [Ktedonospora formicarum]
MMFQKILVPLDGSPLAEAALPVAGRMARSSGGTMMLLQVVDVSYAYLSYGAMQPSTLHVIMESSLASANTYLESVLCRPDLAGVSLKKQVVLGYPASVILSTVNTCAVDLVVMTSHGYTGVKRWVLGSVAEKVIHHAPVPIFILREEKKPLLAHPNDKSAGGVRALIPLDISARSQDVIAPAQALVTALSPLEQGELHLTQMVMVPNGSSKSAREALLHSAKQNLQAVSEYIREGLVAHVGLNHGFKLTWSISQTEDIAEGIVQMAEHGENAEDGSIIAPSNLIAMTTHGYSGIKKWTMGSIASRVLRATRLPVLLVRPADMIREEQLKEES